MGQPRVLVACEYSGRVREAFASFGFEAWSCDFLETEIPGKHFQCDVRDVLGDGWDLLIAHPPCTFLAVSGNRWMKDNPARQEERRSALSFVRLLLDSPIKRKCIENPVSVISSEIRKPDQTIQPYMFGHAESKMTCLWLENIPKLQPTQIILRDRYENQTKSGQNKLGQSPDRWKIRSRTYPGIAAAMAQQWGVELF